MGFCCTKAGLCVYPFVLRQKATGVITVIMLDRVWKMLEEIDATERKKAFDAIIEILSSSEDEEMLQLKYDLLTFEDDILDDSEDPIKTLLEGEK